MITAFEAATRWKKILEYTKSIKDPILRESILADYQQRAIQEWGFCPDNHIYKKKNIELEPWQEVFLKKIKSCLEYGVFIKDEAVEKEARARMREFIRKGGSFTDLPIGLQTQDLHILYIDVLLDEVKLWTENLEFLEKNSLQKDNKNVKLN